MRAHDLLAHAEAMLASHTGRPPSVMLRRATSDVYYALFHYLARDCANLLIGGKNSARSEEACRRVYRSLDHGLARHQCKDRPAMRGFPKPVADFAVMFVAMQAKRHEADYDPMKVFTKAGVGADVTLARSAIDTFKSAKAADRRAFCVHVLFRDRRV